MPEANPLVRLLLAAAANAERAGDDDVAQWCRALATEGERAEQEQQADCGMLRGKNEPRE